MLYLPQVDFIIVLENGTISRSGTYDELMKMGGNFANFLITLSKDCKERLYLAFDSYLFNFSFFNSRNLEFTLFAFPRYR